MFLRKLPFLLTAAFSTFAATQASATVDAYLDYYVPVRHLQTEDICLMKQTMHASIGIPPASQMLGTFAPTRTLMQGAEGLEYVNINLLAAGAPITATYAMDNIDGLVWEYGLEVDLRAVAAANGSSVEGRRATVRAAKLAIVTMAQNLAAISGNRYRLWVTFVGLPTTQADLGEKRVYASTFWPYTASSSLLLTYRAEMINVEGSCPRR